MAFKVSLTTVLITLCYIIPGYLLGKAKKAKDTHLSTLSAILIYVGSPALIISSFLNIDFTKTTTKNMGLFFIITLAIQTIFLSLVYLALRKKQSDAKYRVMTIGSVLGNVGYFGLPIVKALFPSYPIASVFSAVYVVSMNILVFTMGVYCVTGDRKYVSLKTAVFNPSTAGLIIGLILYFTKANSFLSGNFWYDSANNAISLLAKMTTPLCMIILGVRLSTVSFKRLFTNKLAYIIVFGKLIVYPLFAYACVYFLPVAQIVKACVLTLSATPCAAIVLSLAEMHAGERELPSNCILISTILCFLTIPLLTLLI